MNSWKKSFYKNDFLISFTFLFKTVMDFFGHLDFFEGQSLSNNREISENSKRGFTYDKKVFENYNVEHVDGFGCQSEGCENKEAYCGTMYMPYCNENLICMKKNLEYVIAENLQQKGAICVYERIVNKEDFENDLQQMDVSPIIKRKKVLSTSC